MKLKKSLGQNFLRSKSVVKKILDVSEISKNDIVLEIGPGEGIMTEELLSLGKKVVAVEKDDRLIPLLKEKFKEGLDSGKFELIHSDILDQNIQEIISKPYKVVANIPYYITGQILRKFLESNFQPNSMTLMVQKEVAERIVAKDDKESLLSLSVKIFGEPIYVKTVKKSLFRPEPNVDSAIIIIKNINKEKLGGAKEELFFKVIHAGFAHKRKQLLANLSGVVSREKLLEIFIKLHLNQKIRAEDVNLDTWVKLCKKLEHETNNV